MVKFLQNFSFIGGLLICVLGVIMILIVNDTGGHEPELLKKIMTFLVFICGVSIFMMLIIRSKSENQ